MPNQPILEQQTQAYLDSIAAQNFPPIYTLSYAAARQALEDAQVGEAALQPADVDDVVLPVSPSGQVSVRIYRRQDATAPLPVAMYFHGGGWVLGSRHTHDRLLRDLANASGAALVFVNYTPSPEAQFPAPLEEAYAATKYIAEHGEQFRLDGSRLAVAGDSAGGNMAAAVTLLAKERRGPKISYQALLYPVTDASLTQASYVEFADGPWLTTAAMRWFWDAYAPNLADRKKIIAAPLLAALDELAGLPPALVMVAENDPLRDEGEAYALKLMQAGVEVTALRVLGTIHDFALINPLAGTPAARLAVELVGAKLRHAFAQAT